MKIITFILSFLLCSSVWAETINVTKDNVAEVKNIHTQFLEKVYQWIGDSGDKIGKGIEKGTDFVASQAPLVCEDIVRYA